MKAIRLIENSKIVIEEIEKPKILEDDDVLVNIKYSGICGSDYVRFFENQAKYYPIVITHEFSGIVEDVGKNVKNLNKGDKVCCIPLKPCFECNDCNLGNYSLCKNYGFIGSREDGGLQEYKILKEKNLKKLPNNFNLKYGAFFEPLTVVLHGLNVIGSLKNNLLENKSVAVIGVGSIGILALQVLKSMNCIVTAIDIDDEKLEMCRNKFNADYIINSKNENEILNNLNKFDYVIETSGANQSFYISLKLVKNKGNILYIGTPHNDLKFDFRDFELINRKELRIKGSWMNYSKEFPGYEWDKAIELFEKNLINLDEIISDDVDMEGFIKIFEKYKNRLNKGKIFVSIR